MSYAVVAPDSHTGHLLFLDERATAMRNLFRRFLHRLGLPVSKFSTMQERFDDVDQFMADRKNAA